MFQKVTKIFWTIHIKYNDLCRCMIKLVLSNTDMLEKLQYRALRFVFDDYESDYDKLLVRANMPSLELSRLRGLCIQVFKCINNLAPQYMCKMYKLQDKDTHNTRGAKALVQSHYNKVTYGSKTYVSFSTHLWNQLPNNIKAAADLESFKSLMSVWYGVSCKCYMCKWVQ